MFKTKIKKTAPITCVVLLMLLASPAHTEQEDEVMDAGWKKISDQVEKKFETFEKEELNKWETMKKRVMLKWEDPELPEVKKYVEYFDEDAARIKIDYETGTVTVQVLVPEDQKNGQVEAQTKIEKILEKALQPTEAEPPLLFREEIGANQNLKYLAKEVSPKPSIEQGTDGQKRSEYQVSFGLVPEFVRKRAAKIYPTVKFWSEKYKLDPALVLAIIRQESAFNPRAQSWVPAFGLMQIVPKYAGKEVMYAVTKKEIIPDSEFLFDPERNIMLGTTYLQLLRDQYFPNISDELKKTFYLVSSYNWGPTRVANLLSKGRFPAAASTEAVYQTLVESVPAETRGYLQKVTQYWEEFKKILEHEGAL